MSGALTTAQVIQYATAAGFPQETLITVAGIAWRESGNRPDALGDKNNPYPGCTSRGLMQINVCPQYNNKGIWFRENPDVLFDPAANMRAAKELYDDRGFRPWTTYRAGIPAPDTARIEREVAEAGGLAAVMAGAGTVASAAAGAAGAVAGAAGGAFAIFDALLDPNTWLRVGFVLGGAALLGVALVAMSKDMRQRGIGAVQRLTEGGLDADAPELPDTAPAPPKVKAPR